MAEEGTNAGQSHTTGFDRLVVARANRQAIDAAAPGATRETLIELFQGKAPWRTIRAWRAGERFMPAWARDLLDARGAMVRQRAAMLPAGPGKQAGWRNVKGYQLNMRR